MLCSARLTEGQEKARDSCLLLCTAVCSFRHKNQEGDVAESCLGMEEQHARSEGTHGLVHDGLVDCFGCVKAVLIAACVVCDWDGFSFVVQHLTLKLLRHPCEAAERLVTGL